MTAIRAVLAVVIAVLLSAGCAVPPMPPSPSPTTSPAATAVVTNPTATPSVRVECGRIDRPPCDEAIAAARAFAPDAFPSAMLVVVDSECGPGEFCSFNDGIVVVVIPGGPAGSAPWRAFAVRRENSVVELPYPRLNAHILDLLPEEVRPS